MDTSPSCPSDALALSVVIASHRPGYLRDLLTALAGQSMERSLFEIIAVCDYPVQKIQSDFRTVDFHTVNDFSISRKRNFGVARSRAPIVAFVDDDCIPSPDWLMRGYGYLSTHLEAAAVLGFTTVASCKNAIPALREYRRLETFGYRTNNLFLRKTVFQDAGGFDERFTVQREDLDLCFTLLGKGHAIHQCADIKVIHRVRPGEPWDLLKNCVNRRFDPLLSRKHPKRYREQVRSPFPPSLIMLLALHLFVGFAAFLGFRYLTGVLIADGLAISVLAFRRCGTRVPVTVFVTEWVSCLLAPMVLFGTLVYGSIRYRTLLLV
jgi:glycosyltransferase involved in cell wall biosynthesis